MTEEENTLNKEADAMNVKDELREEIEPTSKYSKLNMAIVGFVAFIPYCAVLNAPPVYDDEPAFLHNPDVQGKTDIISVWMNDFWGTPLLIANSHKSYRPLTTLLYRYFHFLWGNWTFPLHLLNNTVHSVVSVIFYQFCEKVIFTDFSQSVNLVSGLLFALHPIHTEAICPIVGCSDMMSALCFMISLWIFSQNKDHKKTIRERNQTEEFRKSLEDEDEPKVLKGTCDEMNQDGLRLRKASQSNTELLENFSVEALANNVESSNEELKWEIDDEMWMTIFYVLTLATHGMLFKETGITVLGVIIAQVLIEQASKLPTNKSFFSIFDFPMVSKFSVILAWSLVLLLFRLWIMNWKSPGFDSVTNPTVYETEVLTRGLTYFYLCLFNFWLLVCPTKLSYDYSRCSIPLVTSFWDFRNILSIGFFSLCIATPIIALFYLRTQTKWSKTFLLGYVLMVVPFLPASNLFFPVGFVVAERVLYLPSAGFIILFVLLWQKALEVFPSYSKYLQGTIAVILGFYLIQTVTRTFAWTSNDSLFSSSLSSYPKNGKMNYNWGTRLENNNRLTEAFAAYEAALKCIPTDHGALLNSGFILEKQGSSDIKRILKFYERGIKSQPAHGRGYLLQANLLIRLQRYDEAATTLTKAIGKLYVERAQPVEAALQLVENWRTAQAKSVYFRLLKSACDKSLKFDHLKECSIVLQTLIEKQVPKLQEKGYRRKAKYLRALIPKVEAVDIKTLEMFRNSFSNVWTVEDGLLAMLSDIKEIPKSEIKVKTDYQDPHKDIWNRAIELFKVQRFSESRKAYESYLQLNPKNFEAKGQYAALLFQIGQQKAGVNILLEITEEDENCFSSGAWHNLATIYGRQFKFEKSIPLLQSCLDKLSKYTKEDLADYKQKHAAIFCQLGKHQFHHSMDLKKDGKTKEAKKLVKKAKKNLNTAIEMDPSNVEAHGTLLEISAKQ